jgi:hypothetical protein
LQGRGFEPGTSGKRQAQHLAVLLGSREKDAV